ENARTRRPPASSTVSEARPAAEAGSAKRNRVPGRAGLGHAGSSIAVAGGTSPPPFAVSDTLAVAGEPPAAYAGAAVTVSSSRAARGAGARSGAVGGRLT